MIREGYLVVLDYLRTEIGEGKILVTTRSKITVDSESECSWEQRTEIGFTLTFWQNSSRCRREFLVPSSLWVRCGLAAAAAAAASF